MRLLMCGNSCGFGPVAKLAALSRMLNRHERIFAGTTIAADFARNNGDAFDTVVSLGPDPAELDRLILDCDHVVCVMDELLLFRVVGLGRPVLFVDSLFAFWQLRRPTDEIAELAATSPRSGFTAIDAHLAALTRHERKYAAHLLADASVVQNFPGVAERVAEIRRQGADRLFVSGSIVDETSMGRPTGRPNTGYDLLMSIGGFKNFLLDYERNNGYLRLFARWIPDLLADWPQFERVGICGGAYDAGRQTRIEVKDRTAELLCLPQRQFLTEVAAAGHYLLTPGLTAIHEATRLGTLPMALPEQHFGHVFNLAGFSGTLFHDLGARFTDLIDGYQVPDDDYVGTEAIIDQVARLAEDDAAYRRFRTGMNTRIETFVGLDDAARDRGVAQLRGLLGGPPVAGILHELFPVGGHRA